MIIGLTGGVGTGKSTVLEYLKEKYNAYIIQADLIAHEVMMPGNKCYKLVVNEFGNDIIDQDKTINRKKLGEITFKDPEKLKILSDIIHPQVRLEIEKIIKKIKEKESDRLIVIEAALLIEAGYKSICDQMWCLYSDLEKRKERLINSRGYSEEKILQIMSNQLTDEEFKEGCDYAINNSNNIENTYLQIEKILEF